MDENQRRMIAERAEFDRTMAELRKEQLVAVEEFGKRAAEKRIREVRTRIFGYAATEPGTDADRDN